MPPETGPVREGPGTRHTAEAHAAVELGAWTVTEEWVRQYLQAVGDEAPAYLESGLAPPLALAACALGSLLERRSEDIPSGAVHSAQEIKTRRGVRFGEEITGVAYLEPARRRGGMRFVTARCCLKDRAHREVLAGKSTVLVMEPGTSPSRGGGADGDRVPGRAGLASADRDAALQAGGLPGVARTITQEQLIAYAGASGDRNPLHLDADFAATTQFGGIIAHGMLTLAFITEMMAEAFGRSWLETGTLSVRFKGAAYLGDELETWGQMTREDTLPEGRFLGHSVAVRNRRSGQELITGAATVAVKG